MIAETLPSSSPASDLTCIPLETAGEDAAAMRVLLRDAVDAPSSSGLVVGWVTETEGPFGAVLSVCAQAAPAKLRAANTLKLRSTSIASPLALAVVTGESRNPHTHHQAGSAH